MWSFLHFWKKLQWQDHMDRTTVIFTRLISKPLSRSWMSNSSNFLGFWLNFFVPWQNTNARSSLGLTPFIIIVQLDPFLVWNFLSLEFFNLCQLNFSDYLLQGPTPQPLSKHRFTTRLSILRSSRSRRQRKRLRQYLGKTSKSARRGKMK